MKRRHEPIPRDFPVQPLKHGQKAEDRATCGDCGLSWDDAIATEWTPAPSGRCPFEYFHVCEEDEPQDVTAGAPELLNALKGMVREFGNQRFNVRKDFHKMVQLEGARRAIARAEGRE